MPKHQYKIDTTWLIVGLLVGLCTGGAWFFPMAFHYSSAIVYGKKPSPFVTAFNLLASTATFGVYILYLLVRYTRVYNKKH